MNATWLGFVVDFFGPLTKTKWGTKALLAISIILAIGYLTYIDKISGEWCVAGMVVTFALYVLARNVQEVREKEFDKFEMRTADEVALTLEKGDEHEV